MSTLAKPQRPHVQLQLPQYTIINPSFYISLYHFQAMFDTTISSAILLSSDTRNLEDLETWGKWPTAVVWAPCARLISTTGSGAWANSCIGLGRRGAVGVVRRAPR